METQMVILMRRQLINRIEDALTERQREKNIVLKPLQETSPEDHLDHPDHPDHLDHLDELGHPDNPDHPVHLDHLDHLHLMFEDLGIYPSKYQRPIWLSSSSSSTSKNTNVANDISSSS